MATISRGSFRQGLLGKRNVRMRKTISRRSGRRPRTTEAERREIRGSEESLRVLASRYGINPKTVAKWKHRETTIDLPRGPRPGRARRLSAEEEGLIVQFREHTLLPLDDCLYALQAHIPHLSRSSLHRCLQRHGVNRLSVTVDAERRIAQETSELGDLHIDHAQVRSNDGVHHLFNAIEQTSKFVFVWMGSSGHAAAAAEFLVTMVERSPCQIKRVFTPDAEPFIANGAETEFGRACRECDIEHHVTSTPHPWTRGQGARMGRILQPDTVFPSEAYLVRLLSQFVHAYDFRRRLKTLRGRTPYEFLCQSWAEEPESFLRDPHHDLVGLEFAHG